MTIVAPEPGDESGYPTVFREFLYADLERTRSLFAQRLGGVPEEDRVTDSALRHYALGVQRYLGVGRENKSEHYEQRSLLDALFPALERLLEVEQWLTDITDIVDDTRNCDPDLLHKLVEPGSIVRITSKGQLFDASYIAKILAGTSAAADGISTLSTVERTAEASDSRAGSRKSKAARARPPQVGNASEPQLEDMIEEFAPEIMGGVSAGAFRAMVKVSRGMFPNGLHLLLNTQGAVGWTATARLQRDRQYLDADPDVLFSRYGTTPLDWTVVGTIGHFSKKVDPNVLTNMDFLASDGTISRPKFVAGLNALMSLVASQGIADTPPFPGFSIIPLAVYRLIPRAVSEFTSPLDGQLSEMTESRAARK